jgi:hypothetical protein
MSTSNSRFILLPGAALLALITLASAAQAQDLEAPRRRQGYYFALGLGNGMGQNWEDGDRLDAAPSSKFTFRTGQLLTPRLGLGLIIESSASKKDQIQAGLFGLGIEGHVVLVKNLALRGSVSMGILQIKDDADPDDLKGTYGALYGVGLSYEFFPTSFQGSGGFAITPTFDVRGLPGETAANLAAFVGVELAWWTGLPRNQLELPDSEAYKK